MQLRYTLVYIAPIVAVNYGFTVTTPRPDSYP